MKITVLVGLFVLALGTGAMAQEKTETSPPDRKPDPTLTLRLGNPRLSDKTMEVSAGTLMSAEKGERVGFDRMIREMDASRFIYVGETHNSMPMHDLQFEVLRAVYARDRHLAVGMEMLPVTVQETLNKWSAGLLTKEEFIREVRWYVNWNFHFGYYEKIFDFAKEHRLPVLALNVPRDVISKLRMRGWNALTPKEKAFFPGQPDVTNEEHRSLIRAIFESMEMPHQMKGPGLDQVFEGLYRAQSAWDEVMGANVVRGFEKEGRRVVVCAGSGHLIYNLGLNFRASKGMPAPFKTVIAVVVPEAGQSIRVSRTLGDYIRGLNPEDNPAYPGVGLALKNVEDLENLVVDGKPMDGAASRADFEKGDVILSVGGRPYGDINELRTELARLGWGDEVKFRILRDGTVKEVLLKFDKSQPEPGDIAEKKSPS